MLTISIIAILIVMLLALLRAFVGPTLGDRVLAVNLLGTKMVLFIAVLSFVANRAFFLDIAMIYALLNFVGTIGVLRFFEHQRKSNKIKDKDKDVAKGSTKENTC